MPGTLTDPQRRPRAAELASGTLLGADFRIERQLGTGGMGAVYVARQLSTGRDRALKVMHSDLVGDVDLRARFEREARVSAAIRSDHVVDVIAAGIDEPTGMPWFAMELLEGETLASKLAREGVLAPPVVRELVMQLGHALGAAHAAGVVHRDLKPENVFLQAPQREAVPFVVKVLDFGIAKIVSGSATHATAPLGTPLWMAPEQTLSDGVVKPATDVWAFGLIVFRMLTGKHYWLGANLAASSPAVIVREIAVDEIPPASARATALGVGHSLPPGFDAWFARCVARNPADRFVDGSAARTAILALLDRAAGGTAASPAPEPTTRRGPSTRRRLKWGVIVALLAAAALARMNRHQRPRHEDAPHAAASGTAASQPSTAEHPVDIDEDTTTVWRVPIGDSPTLGPADALVTLVTFADFECPFAKILSGTSRALRKRYPDALRLVWKDLPLGIHVLSEPATTFARSAAAQKGPSSFWTVYDKMYTAPRRKDPLLPGQPAIDEPELLRMAPGLGLDPRRTATDLREHRFRAAIAADVALADELHVEGTPISFVNGRRVAGSQPEHVFAKIIEEEIARAEALVARGVPRRMVYDAMMKDARPGPGRKLNHKSVTVPDGAPSFGGGPGALVIQEFGDHLNIFSKVTDRALRSFVEHQGGRVRLVWRDAPNPKNPESQRTAMVAASIFSQRGSDAFWKLHDLIATHASERGHIEDDKLRRYMAQSGVEPGTLMYLFSDSKTGVDHTPVPDDSALEAPAIVVGDIVFNPMPPILTLERLVDDLLGARHEGETR
jgi:protein-disulfide isomerase